MSTSLLVVAAGAAVATAGTAMLAARCVRTPRAFLMALTLASFALAVALGAQLLGGLTGYTPLIFRAMEVGAQVIGPAGLCLCLAELVARSLAVRFGVRLLIGAVTVVAAVVLGSDPLNTAASFSKAWPDPLVYYQVLPKPLISFVIAPGTALIALIALVVTAIRSGRDAGSRARLTAVALAAVAVLALAMLGITTAYTGRHAGFTKGVGPALYDHLLFVAGCCLAAGLSWIAGLRAARVGAPPRNRSADREDDADWAGRPDQDGLGAGGVASLAASGPGGYSGSRVYRPEADRPTAAYQQPGSGQDRAAGDETHQLTGQRGGPGAASRADQHDRGWQSGPDHDADGYGWGESDPGNDGYGAGSAASGSLARGSHAAGPLSRPDAADAGYGAKPLAAAAGAGPGGYGTDQLPEGRGQFGGADGYDDDGSYADDGQAQAWSQAPGGYDGDPAVDALDSGRGRSYPDPGNGDGIADWAGSQRDYPAAGHQAQPQMFGQIAIYTLLADRADDFDRLTSRLVREVRANEPATLVYIVHAVPTAPMQRILYEVYADRAAYEAHRLLPYMVRFEADRRPLVLATNVIELGLQQAKVSPFPSISDVLQQNGIDPADVTGPMPRDLIGPPRTHSVPSRDAGPSLGYSSPPPPRTASPPRGYARPPAAAGYRQESTGGYYDEESQRYR